MGLLTRIKEFFGQAAAETGVATPQAETAVDVVEIHRTDVPPELPHELPRRETIDGPLNFPDAADPPERLH